MIKHIMKADWLDDKSRRMVVEKMKEMKTKIGHPEWYNNDTALMNHYRGVRIFKNINIYFKINKIKVYNIITHKNFINNLFSTN